MKNCLRYLFAVLLFFPLLSKSQAPDTVFRYYPQFTKYYLIDHPDTSVGIDTSVVLFNRFHPAEMPFAYMHLGWLGAPERSLYLTPITTPDIDIGFHQFDLYWRSVDEVKLYDTREPYTAFYYQQGTKSEILVNLIHTQNITPHLSLGVDYNRNRTDGIYLRQQSKISNFDAFLRYNSPNNFYRGTVIYVLNDLKLQQNGGVKSDSVFSNEGFFNRGLVPVSLNYADARWRNDEVVITNAIHFGKKVYEGKKDSVQKGRIVPRIRLQQRFEWEKRSFFYSDELADTAFYPNYELFTDSVIRDSFLVTRFMNEFRVSKFKEDSAIHKVNFSADAWFRHSVYDITNESLKENFQEGIVGASFTTSFFSKLFLNAEGQLNLLDRNAGDFLLRAKLSYQFVKGRSLMAEGLIANNHPSIVAQRYQSAFFNWDNNFSNNTTSSLSGSYVDQKWNLALKGTFLTQSNFIYWDINGIPVQYNQTLTGLELYFMKNLRVTRFHFDNEIGYQSYSSDIAVAYPSFIWRSSLYYFNTVFRGALQVKTGIDLNYRSAYYAPAYQPATGQFLIQRYESLSYFPVIDLYVNVRIRAVRAFVTLQNVNQDIGYKGNFSGYHYPMPDRTFKVGFQWLFWN